MAAPENSFLLGHRDFKVRYQELSAGVWRTTAEVKDDLHEIVSKLDINLQERRVMAAELEFRKCPFEECKLAIARAKDLIGTLVKKLGFKNYRVFLGKSGCPNAYLLFGLSGPAFSDVYDLNLVAAKKLSQEDYNLLSRNECVAHRAIIANTSQGKSVQ